MMDQELAEEIVEEARDTASNESTRIWDDLDEDGIAGILWVFINNNVITCCENVEQYAEDPVLERAVIQMAEEIYDVYNGS